MKHLIKNNKIVGSGIPSIFKRPNGEIFYGGYDKMTELHYQDGWRDEIIPVYNPKKQELGNVYYDINDDICKYVVVDKVINLTVEKDRLYNDLANLKKEIAVLAMQAKLTYDIEPKELTDLLSLTRGLNNIAKAEIDALTEENVLDYVLRGKQVEEIIKALNSFL